jgi:hypothetical protein
MRFRKTLAFLTLAMALVFALSAWAQQKPFTQEQVSNMVRDGFGDESGAKLIEQRGIDFAPTEDFIQTLKAAGASEAFLKALRAAKPPEPASAKKPLNQVQVFALLVGQVPSHRVTMLVQERGIDFEPTDDYRQEVCGLRRHCLLCRRALRSQDRPGLGRVHRRDVARVAGAHT